MKWLEKLLNALLDRHTDWQPEVRGSVLVMRRWTGSAWEHRNPTPAEEFEYLSVEAW